MQILLFDTSVWIDYLQGRDNTKTELLNEYLLSTSYLRTCPVIIQEILQGVKNDTQFSQLSNDLGKLMGFSNDPIESAIGAAQIYRNLRKKGVTIRKPNDCLIAYYAISNDVKLVHNDSDFDLIAQHTSLKIWN
jgi:hypothetical protein